MMKFGFWQTFFRFLLLIPLQVFLFNYIPLHFSSEIHIYLLAILMIPLNTPACLVLFLSFASGFLVDTFCGLIGIHAAAATLMGFVRILFFKMNHNYIGEIDGESSLNPSFYTMGFVNYLKYVSLCLFCYFVFFYFLESLNLLQILGQGIGILISIIYTTLAMLFIQWIFVRRKKY